MPPVSIPFDPPQPPVSPFPIQSLYRVRVWTLDSYRLEFGVDPGWDDRYAPQYWFISDLKTDDPNEIVNVGFHLARGPNDSLLPKMVKLQLPAWQAGRVNIPHEISYQNYDPGTTPATRMGTTIGALDLSTLTQAAQMRDELLAVKVPVVGIVEETVPPPAIDWNGEIRRMYAILIDGGRELNVGRLIYQKNLAGVERPGEWVWGEHGLAWVPRYQSSVGRFPAVDVPLRGLLPNESLFLPSPIAVPMVQVQP